MSDPSSDEAEKRRQLKIQRQLDEALAATFPASDPVAIVTSEEEEEDWGTGAAPPTAPAKNTPAGRS
jgi:fructose-1,6-bisphosphatase